MANKKLNYCLMYIVINNYFRRKAYHYSSQIPYSWIIYQNTPDLLEKLKYYCGSKRCADCEFTTSSPTKCCLAIAATKY